MNSVSPDSPRRATAADNADKNQETTTPGSTPGASTTTHPATSGSRPVPKTEGKKKTPTGKCWDCDAPTYTSSVRRARCDQRIVAIPTPDGPCDVQVADVRASSMTIFGAYYFPNPLPLAESASCGEFLDVLLGLLRCRPQYVREEDRRRNLSLLYAFKTFLHHQVRGESQGSPKTDADLPLRSFCRVAESWIAGTKDHEQPLMLTYVVGAVEFAVAHALGVNETVWQIRPMFPTSEVSSTRRDYDFFWAPP